MKGLGVGRIVHYQLSNGEVRPAIITRVIDPEIGRVGLRVFNDANDPPGIAYDETIGEPGVVDHDAAPNPSPCTWHWPPRV